MATPARPALALLGALACISSGSAHAVPDLAPILATLPPDEKDPFPASWWLDKALEAGIPEDLRDDAALTMLDLGQTARAFEYISSTTGEDVDVWRANIYRRLVERFVASKDTANTTRAFQGALEAAEFLPAQSAQQRSASADLARAAALAGVEPALDRALSRLQPSDMFPEDPNHPESRDPYPRARSFALLAVDAGHANLARKLCTFALPNLFNPPRGVAPPPVGSEILIALADAGKASEMEVLAGGDFPLAARLYLMAHFARTGNAAAARTWRTSAESAVPGTWTTDDATAQLAWEKAVLNDIHATFDFATQLHELKAAEPRQIWLRLKDEPPLPQGYDYSVAQIARRTRQLRDEAATMAVVGFIKAGQLDRADSILSSWEWYLGEADARRRAVLALADAGRLDDAFARVHLITRSGDRASFDLQRQAVRILSEKFQTAGRTDLLRKLYLDSENGPRIPLSNKASLDGVGRFLGAEELEKITNAYTTEGLSNNPDDAIPALARYADRRRLSDWISSQPSWPNFKGRLYLLAARALARSDDNSDE